MQHQLPDLPYAADALEPHISAETLSFHHGKHHRDLRHQAERADRRDGVRRSAPGRGHQNGQRGHLQQRRPDLESQLLLELPLAERGRCAHGQDRGGDRCQVGLLRQVQGRAHAVGGDELRLRLDLAREERARGARGPEHGQRGKPADRGQDADSHHRRLGARVLHRLQECQAAVHRGLLAAGELGFRQPEPVAEALGHESSPLGRRSLHSAPRKGRGPCASNPGREGRAGRGGLGDAEHARGSRSDRSRRRQ